jgi:hypothetical protein
MCVPLKLDMCLPGCPAIPVNHVSVSSSSAVGLSRGSNFMIFRINSLSAGGVSLGPALANGFAGGS